MKAPAESTRDARAANTLRIFAFFIDIALLFEALSSANWTGYIRSAEGV